MRKKHNEGFSLIDVLVGIALLALVVIPACTGLVMSARINDKAEQLLQDQLAVSSAVETLLAEGIQASKIEEKEDGSNYVLADYTNVRIRAYKNDVDDACYEVTVKAGEVSVSTHVRPALASEGDDT